MSNSLLQFDDLDIQEKDRDMIMGGLEAAKSRLENGDACVRLYIGNGISIVWDFENQEMDVVR